jgi:hypothetical protein
VPGSYAANMRGTVKTQPGETKQFSSSTSSATTKKQLDDTMREEGWNPVEHWRYAEEYHPRLLLLYQRVKLAHRRARVITLLRFYQPEVVPPDTELHYRTHL